jgi:sarcosine oxidase subunit beta
MQTADVVVVGGGVVGSSSAYRLALAGLNVIHVERARPAVGASGASAGGVRQQARDPRELELALFSIGLWTTLESELEADVEYRRDGHITLVEDVEDVPRLEARVTAERVAGLDIWVAGPAELRELVPGISTNVLAGSYCPTDGHANPTLTTMAFAQAARRAGARSWQQTRVTGVQVTSGRITGVTTSRGPIACEWLVNAAGGWADRVAAFAGVQLPIQPRGLQMIETVACAPMLKPVLGSMRRMLSLKQVPSGRFLIGGGWPGRIDVERFQASVLADSLAASPAEAIAVLPALAEVDRARNWAGFEAFTPDEVPIIQSFDSPRGLIVAAGFSGHGFALSPGVGVVVERLVTGGTLPVPVVQFGVERFARSDAHQAPAIAAKAG